MQLPSTLAQMMKCRAGSIGLPGADHARPPAGLAGDRMGAGDMLVAGQRMADQDRVAAVGVQRAIGFIGDVDRRQRAAAVERAAGPAA